MHRRLSIYIGTSGWSYSQWKERFYPTDLPRRQWLSYYAGRFNSVEINSSFYRLPSLESIAQWRDSVPERFLFCAKVSRYITHMKKLKDSSQPMSNFLDVMNCLGDQLGPLVFQLPPRWRFNSERLHELLGCLGGNHRYAFEFRDRSWFNDEAVSLLHEYGAALCIYDLDGYQSPREVTADFIYVRLHGPGAAYQGRYSRRFLDTWATRLMSWRQQGKDVFCYFDNDEAAYAAENAQQLQAIVSAL